MNAPDSGFKPHAHNAAPRKKTGRIEPLRRTLHTAVSATYGIFDNATPSAKKVRARRPAGPANFNHYPT